MNLSTWFLKALDDYYLGLPTLPRPPFHLYPWVRVEGDRIYERLELEVRGAIDFQDGKRPQPPFRFKTGALQRDLARLHYLSKNIQANHDQLN